MTPLSPRLQRLQRRLVIGASRGASAGFKGVAGVVIRVGAGFLSARRLDVTVQGRANLPETGPVLIVARHFHHLYDGAILLSALPRPAHLVVALDWARGRWVRRGMEWACAAARWPVVLRADGPALLDGTSAYRPTDTGRYLRRALHDATTLLRAGRMLVIFPEAYPNVDPDVMVKRREDDFLPFRPGYLTLADLAQRDRRTRVAIVPAGFVYTYTRARRGGSAREWRVTLRLGTPRYLDARADHATLARAIEDDVHALSAPTDPVG